jgi:hypothetical protein
MRDGNSVQHFTARSNRPLHLTNKEGRNQARSSTNSDSTAAADNDAVTVDTQCVGDEGRKVIKKDVKEDTVTKEENVTAKRKEDASTRRVFFYNIYAIT